jgi:hypothetical protein
LLSGTYTELPPVGAVIAAGRVLYRVDNQPVVLMTGTTPAWRPFAAGITDGPDVAELQSNLIGIGDATGLFSTASGHLDALTVVAIERWQRAQAQPVTGQIALGQVIFLASAVVVGAESVATGQAASPGDLPYQVTTTARTVIVPSPPTSRPSVSAKRCQSCLPTMQPLRERSRPRARHHRAPRQVRGRPREPAPCSPKPRPS